MSGGPDKAAELQLKARANRTRERVAELDRERAGLDEVAQHLAVDVRNVEARLEAARARCQWLSNKLALSDKQTKELDARIAAMSGEVAALEAQRRSAEAESCRQAEELRLRQKRLRAQQRAFEVAERELAEVVERIQRLGYVAERWAQHAEFPR